MSRWAHYRRAWRELPADERRIRAERIVDRWLRRDPRIRRIASALRLVEDPPGWRRFSRALRVSPATLAAALREADPSRHPLWGPLGARAEALAGADLPKSASILARAEALLDRRFDLLGSGPCRPLRADGGIDWHRDFKRGVRWDPEVFHLDVVTVRGDGSDVKVPWELSRAQHLPLLGEAWHLAPHLLPPDRAEALRHRLAAETVAEIDDWIVRNPVGCGVNWACPMDVAIRAAAWIAAIALLRAAPELGDPFLLRAARALWRHGKHLRAHLEIGGDGLTSNHYLADVTGLLTIATALPEIDEAEGWRRFAWEAVVVEMERQVHDDGVDFERSIPYHRLVAEMFVHAALLARGRGEPLPSRFEQRLSRMLEFTAAYTRPDGSVPCWGDQDDGRFLPLDGYAASDPLDHRHLLALGGRLLDRADLAAAGRGGEWESGWLLGNAPQATAPPAGMDSAAYPSGGYAVLRRGDLHVGVGCGSVGTGGLGNHTHNDLFAPCVWAVGREWITDPGTGVYTSDPAVRNRLRGVAAHATLQIDALEPNRLENDLDGLFRMTERANPVWSFERHPDASVSVTGTHGGYVGEAGGFRHTRRIALGAEGRTLEIVDRLEAGGAAATAVATVRFPVPPGVSIRIVDASTASGSGRVRGRAALTDDAGRELAIAWDLPAGATATVGPSIHSPRYGVVVPSKTLVLAFDAVDGASATTTLSTR